MSVAALRTLRNTLLFVSRDARYLPHASGQTLGYVTRDHGSLAPALDRQHPSAINRAGLLCGWGAARIELPDLAREVRR